MVMHNRAIAIALVLLTVAVNAAYAADQSTPVASGVYRCRDKNGVTAFVSKLDSTLTDCVNIADTTAHPLTSSSDQPARSSSAPRADDKPHLETRDEHDDRMKQMLAQVSKWCEENNRKPNEKPKERAQNQQTCVLDKMGTYNLLYP